jgi:hypothetical protein
MHGWTGMLVSALTLLDSRFLNVTPFSSLGLNFSTSLLNRLFSSSLLFSTSGLSTSQRRFSTLFSNPGFSTVSFFYLFLTCYSLFFVCLYAMLLSLFIYLSDFVNK